MKNILDLLRRLGLTSVPVTEETFYGICEREGIRVVTSSFPFCWWMMVDGQPVIVLDQALSGLELLFKEMHELGHHFLHGGNELEDVHAFGGNNSVKEAEADMFAYLALCPTKLLLSGALSSDSAEDPYMPEFRREREKLYFLYDQ